MFHKFKALIALFIIFGSKISLGEISVLSEPSEFLRFDLRFEALSSLDNTVDETVSYQRQLPLGLRGLFAARVVESGLSLSALNYQAEVSLPVLGFLALSARFNDSTYFSDGVISSTTILTKADLRVMPFKFFGIFGSFGWYFRFNDLTGIPLVPNFGGSFGVQDFSAAFGLEGRPWDNLGIRASASTFETMDVFNLHNFFFQAAADYHMPNTNWTGFAYARYRLLLGFGRLDAFMAGVGMQFQLDKPRAI